MCALDWLDINIVNNNLSFILDWTHYLILDKIETCFVFNEGKLWWLAVRDNCALE
jgi:hypothetical protein